MNITILESVQVHEFRISYLAVARVSGEDAADFLQSQLTADVLAIEPGATGFAGYCTPKGQVLGLLLIGRQGDDYLLAARTGLMPGLLKRLGMFVLRSDVTLLPEPAYGVTGAPGPEYRFGDDLPSGLQPEGWQASELRAGIAWLDDGTVEKFIPQMLGHDAIGAVSFRKGCYPGQEIVARARYLGKVKRLPAVMEIDGRLALVNGSRLRLARGGDWIDAVLVDHAVDGDRTVLFTVARDSGGPEIEAVELDGQRYRCATT